MLCNVIVDVATLHCRANCVGSVKQVVQQACDHRDHLLHHLEWTGGDEDEEEEDYDEG